MLFTWSVYFLARLDLEFFWADGGTTHSHSLFRTCILFKICRNTLGICLNFLFIYNHMDH